MAKTAVFMELTQVLRIDREQYRGEISSAGSIYVLEWWDGVTQHEQELYPTLATALMRLAVLEHATTTDRMFETESASLFAKNAIDFLECEVND